MIVIYYISEKEYDIYKFIGYKDRSNTKKLLKEINEKKESNDIFKKLKENNLLN